MAGQATLCGKITLLLENDARVRDNIAEFLTRRGATVLVPSTAEDALAAISQDSPSIALLDIGFPDRNGLKLLRNVRALDPQNGGDVPVLAITGVSGVVGRTRAIAAGCQGLLEKPFHPVELLKAIEEVLRDI